MAFEIFLFVFEFQLNILKNQTFQWARFIEKDQTNKMHKKILSGKKSLTKDIL